MPNQLKKKRVSRSNPRDTGRSPEVSRPRAAIVGDDDLFPWPWRVVSSFSSELSLRNASVQSTESLVSPEEQCRQQIERLLDGEPLPASRSFELYLIRGIGEFRPKDSAPRPVVAFPPEFVFVLDVGYPALVGVSVNWIPTVIGQLNGYGDPTFPDWQHVSVRSIHARTGNALLYPDVAGEILIGLVDGVGPDTAKSALAATGLKNISITGTLVTATCKPFRELAVCRSLEHELPKVVRYAQANRVVRLVDLPWTVVRLS